jgi:hypothetical protein
MAEQKGQEFIPYVVLEGTVRDDFGDYIPGVQLTYTSQTLTVDGSIAKQPVTDFGSNVNDTFTETSQDPITIPVQFTLEGITDSKGSFKLYILPTDFVSGSVQLYFKPPQNTTLGDKQINGISTKEINLVEGSTETKSEEELREYMPNSIGDIKISTQTIYDLGDITLSGFTFAFEELQRSIRDKVNIVEARIVNIANSIKLPTEEQLIKLFQERKEQLKQNLLPILIELFKAFGPSIIQAIQSGANKAILSKLKSCPTQQEIKILIEKRNRLVKQLNIVYSIVKILRILGVSTTVIITALKVGLASYNATPTPLPPAADTAKGALEKRLELYGILATGLTTVTSMIGYILGLIIDYLNKLDFLIKECSEEQDIPFESLNDELNNLADPVLIKQMQNNEIVYKGFTLKVELTPITSGKYQSRVGIAYDASNTPVLKTPSSFTSNPELLLQQLQLVIDTQDLKAI